MLDPIKEREDFGLFLKEMGLSVLAMDQAKARMPDPIPSPVIRVLQSEIEGVGAFSTCDYGANEMICFAMISDSWTEAGRYANHSSSPNGEILPTRGGLKLSSLSPIEKGEEITVNYRNVRLAVQAKTP